MTQEEFKVQMDRLIKTYGKPAYPDERLALIWQEVADFDSPWLAKIVGELIGTSRQAPLVDAFQKAVTDERERRWAKEREVEKVEAQKFIKQRIDLPDEDRQMMFDTIRARIRGEVPDDQWERFMVIVNTLCGGDHPDPSGIRAAAMAQNIDPPPASAQAPLSPEQREALAERQRRSLPYIDN